MLNKSSAEMSPEIIQNHCEYSITRETSLYTIIAAGQAFRHSQWQVNTRRVPRKT